MQSNIYKIKDSVDLFLSDDKYLMAYFMNTRQRRTFKVNEWTVHLLEEIDGKKATIELEQILNEKYKIDPSDIDEILELMEKNRIITRVEDNFDILPQYDQERYDRQINYFSEFFPKENDGLLAQKKLMNSKIIIFGCGAVGGTIAEELAMAGVQDITLFDYDSVELSDTSRHMYYKVGTEEKLKTEVLKDRIHEIDCRIRVTCINDSMKPNEDIENLIVGMDFVVNTLDEPYIGYTSSKISRICIKHNIAHFIAGGFDAHLASTGEIIIPYVTPCVECYAGYFKKTLAGWKPKKHPVVQRYREIGGLASMTLFSASFACVEIIKYITGLVNMDNSYKVRGELLFSNIELTYLKVEKNPDCPICGKKGTI